MIPGRRCGPKINQLTEPVSADVNQFHRMSEQRQAICGACGGCLKHPRLTKNVLEMRKETRTCGRKTAGSYLIGQNDD